MIPEGKPGAASVIDSFASFVYTARRATATVNTGAERLGISAEDINFWLILRVLRVEGSQRINNLAWQLVLSKTQMLGLIDTLEREKLIVYEDPETLVQFQRKISISETGQGRLVILEDRFQSISEDFQEAMRPDQMARIARVITRVIRHFKKPKPQEAAPKA